MRTFWQVSPNLITSSCTSERICVRKICFLITYSTVRYGTSSVRTEFYNSMLIINSKKKKTRCLRSCCTVRTSYTISGSAILRIFFSCTTTCTTTTFLFRAFFPQRLSRPSSSYSRSSFSDFFWMDITLKMSRQVWGGGAWT